MKIPNSYIEDMLDYANVSMGRVWEIYQMELPKLRTQLAGLLRKLPPPQKI